ncbi:hypothetical protein AGABI1DRAFT_130361 [Agaricus bisporus var. burnettii JB137-S8]|uniref:Uncharacterized protein n=1 Tax=Agaricus bisporus var. burnettii (strain JB137-S8 / ATCC MYA-4627 / FGSC 10392) TaxID=597362 RepID=K5VT99_AGABU|nr:uncharacterized protein AGABI1DRAFT_130361 [Agaricus bisporus var. burnettii JB137-S8]EKM77669.1 hypothetical protein AGABI1DRAFT_130361 [Agaricus bisporus var. burnettii JB137-S8]
MVEQEQRIHFQGIQDSPVKMWEALEAVHCQRWAGMQFNAYDDLSSIRKLKEGSLQSLINRVESFERKIKELRPSSFTLKQLDDELASMALIRVLPDEFSGFMSSLLLMDKLDKTTVHQAFVTEDLQCKKHAQDSSTSSHALAAHSGSQNTTKTLQERGPQPKTPYKRANKAQKESGSSSSTQTPEKAQRVTEFAGNANTPHPSSSPSPFTPLQLDADFHWLAGPLLI